MKKILLTTIVIVFSLKTSFAQNNLIKQEGDIGSFMGKPHLDVKPLFNEIRHPNIVVTLKGTVLATLGDKKLLIRRSENGGITWEKETIIAEPAFQGGGLTVDESNGNIIAFAEDHHPPAPLSVYRLSLIHI